MKKPLISIIIPIFNEAQTVKNLLRNVYKYKNPLIEREIIIIESNSTDGSRNVVKNFARGKKNIKLLLQRNAKGKGNAIREGLKVAKGDIILFQDADLEYKVDDYSRILQPILKNQADFVLGSRHLKDDGKSFQWQIRKFKRRERIYAYFMNIGGVLFHNFFNLLYRTNISDPTTMYKVFRKKLLKNIYLEGDYFELDWEIVAKFIRLGFIPVEVPIKYKARNLQEGKKIRFFRDVWRWIYTIIKFRLVSIESFKK